MWPTTDDLSTMATIAHSCWTWMPTVTTALRFATAAAAFIVGVHRTIRYVRSGRRADPTMPAGGQPATRSTTPAATADTTSSTNGTPTVSSDR